MLPHGPPDQLCPVSVWLRALLSVPQSVVTVRVHLTAEECPVLRLIFVGVDSMGHREGQPMILCNYCNMQLTAQLDSGGAFLSPNPTLKLHINSYVFHNVCIV